MEAPGYLISVVVPTYNRRESLVRLLTALQEQTLPRHRFEVVVVDDGSSDGTVERARGLDVEYPLRVLQAVHGGPSRARNAGVAAARAPVVVFLDDDVLPHPRLLEEHLAARNEGSGKAGTVVIGPMSPPRDWPRPLWIRWVEESLQRQYRAMVAGEYACGWRQFYTANASVPRDRFLDVGGFDDSYLRNEDVELAHRLALAGVGFVFHPKADVLHYAQHSLEGWRRANYLYGRYDVAMTRDKGLKAFRLACSEFHGRHPLNRLAARLCTGRPLLYKGAVGGLSTLIRASNRSGAERVGGLALSALYSVLYWQGACDEVGSRDTLWRAVDARRPAPPAITARPA